MILRLLLSCLLLLAAACWLLLLITFLEAIVDELFIKIYCTPVCFKLFLYSLNVYLMQSFFNIFFHFVLNVEIGQDMLSCWSQKLANHLCCQASLLRFIFSWKTVHYKQTEVFFPLLLGKCWSSVYRFRSSPGIFYSFSSELWVTFGCPVPFYP